VNTQQLQLWASW